MVDKKALILVLIFLTALSFVNASPTINDYRVQASIPLGDMITATGVLTDANGSVDNYLCSFYFLDVNGNLVKRATDQYTTSTGRFTMLNVYANEPIFKRGEQYTILTECKGVTKDANFVVAQRETISNVGKNEFEYITNPQNTDTFFIWGSIIGIILLSIMFLFGVIKLGGK